MFKTLVTALILVCTSAQASIDAQADFSTRPKKLTANDLIEQIVELKARQGLGLAEQTETVLSLIQQNRISESDLRQALQKKFNLSQAQIQSLSEKTLLRVAERGDINIENYRVSHTETAFLGPLMIVPVFCIFHPAGAYICTAGVFALVWAAFEYL